MSAGRLTLSNSLQRLSAIAELDSGKIIGPPAREIRPSLGDRPGVVTANVRTPVHWWCRDVYARPPQGRIGQPLPPRAVQRPHRLTYADESWDFGTRGVAYGSHKNVAAYNNEQTTSGYETVKAAVAWMPSPSIRLETHVDNVFDPTYQEHLAALNRAGGNDITVGSRLYGAESTLRAGIIGSF